jgi:hypothetical protein
MPETTKPTPPEFREHPGCRERQLHRRCNNPLFPPAVRAVTAQDLEAARREDDAERSAFDTAFAGLLKEVANLPAHVETEIILDLKQRLDPLYDQCAGVAGDTTRERQALVKLYKVFHRTLQAAAGNDPLAASELAEEDAARAAHFELLAYAVVADLLRPDSAIEPDELVPTLLSESEDALHAALTLFDQEQLALIQSRARALAEQLRSAGDLPPELPARLATIDAHLMLQRQHT